jgi:hypothetical protein
MGTPFSTIYDRFIAMVKDYRLDALYVKDKDSFYEFLKGFLLNSIDMFDGALQDLTYISQTETNNNVESTVYYFNNTLTSKEIYILCLGVMIAWYQNDLNDVTQFRLHLNVKDFKTYSEQANLKQRSEVLDKMREDLSKHIIEYQLKNLTSLPFFDGGDIT